MSKTLEALCRPIVHSVCRYWYAAHVGVTFTATDVRRDLYEQLTQIRTAVEDDPIQKREFTKIERPLAFFIDYTIQEGGFHFGHDWQGFSREYNEFSGDEKFFDFLSNTLDDPDSSQQLMMYYLFMGLGFNGCHSDMDYIERRMKVCAARISPGFCPGKDSLSAPDIFENPQLHVKNRKKLSIISWVLIVLCILLGASMWYTVYVYRHETSGYRDALRYAAESARWGKDRNTGATTDEELDEPHASGATLMKLPDFSTIQQEKKDE